MKILNCVLFLTFLEFLYVKRAAGMMTGQSSGNSPTQPHLILIQTTSNCEFYATRIFSVPENEPLYKLPSLRPRWLIIKEKKSFPTFQIYIEMAHGRRYIAESFRGQHANPSCLRDGQLHYFHKATVDIGDIRYEAEDFKVYEYNQPHPEVAGNNPGGRMYYTIKGTEYVRYADLIPQSYTHEL